MLEQGKNSESALEGEADFASDCTSCCAPPWELVASFREWLSHKQLDRCYTMDYYINLQREVSCGLSTPLRLQVGSQNSPKAFRRTLSAVWPWLHALLLVDA
jgi:hypothetical protein